MATRTNKPTTSGVTPPATKPPSIASLTETLDGVHGSIEDILCDALALERAPRAVREQFASRLQACLVHVQPALEAFRVAACGITSLADEVRETVARQPVGTAARDRVVSLGDDED